MDVFFKYSLKLAIIISMSFSGIAHPQNDVAKIIPPILSLLSDDISCPSVTDETTIAGNFFPGSQGSIDGFAGVTRIEGNLILNNIDDSIDLSPLNQLSEVLGSIVVNGTTLTELNGFPCLQSVFFSGIEIANNPNLRKIAEFNRLSVAGGLNVINNDSLESFTGFRNLNAVSGNAIADIIISDNLNLVSIPGFLALRGASGVVIEDNASLTQFTGFPLLENVFRAIRINSNPQLIALPKFESIQSANLIVSNNDSLVNFVAPDLSVPVGIPGRLPDGSLIVSGNRSLRSFSSAGSSNTVLRDLQVFSNESLETFSGFDSIVEVVFGITILDNPNLVSMPTFPSAVLWRDSQVSRNPKLTCELTLDVSFSTGNQQNCLVVRSGDNRTAQNLPDLDMVTSEINILDNLMLSDIEVGVNIFHSKVSDLRITLTKGDTTIELLNRPTTPSGDTCTGQSFDINLRDNAEKPINTSCRDAAPAFENGIFHSPKDSLSAFGGINAQGPWVLTLIDTTATNAGVLLDWDLKLTGRQP